MIALSTLNVFVILISVIKLTSALRTITVFGTLSDMSILSCIESITYDNQTREYAVNEKPAYDGYHEAILNLYVGNDEDGSIEMEDEEILAELRKCADLSAVKYSCDIRSFNTFFEEEWYSEYYDGLFSKFKYSWPYECIDDEAEDMILRGYAAPVKITGRDTFNVSNDVHECLVLIEDKTNLYVHITGVNDTAHLTVIAFLDLVDPYSDKRLLSEFRTCIDQVGSSVQVDYFDYNTDGVSERSLLDIELEEYAKRVKHVTRSRRVPSGNNSENNTSSDIYTRHELLQFESDIGVPSYSTLRFPQFAKSCNTYSVSFR